MEKLSNKEMRQYFSAGNSKVGYMWRCRECKTKLGDSVAAYTHLNEKHNMPQVTISPVAPLLTMDFFNWIAKELTDTRRELETTREMLHQFRNAKVSEELNRIYSEYTKR